MDSPSPILDKNKSTPPSPSPSPSGKVCIVSIFSGLEKTYYALFIVDLESPVLLDHGDGDGDGDGDSDDLIPRVTPTILLDLDLDSMRRSDTTGYTFCVLNSTLYLFQNGRRAFYTPRRWKSVYTYDLSSHLNGKDQSKSAVVVVVVVKSMLCPAPEMLCPKNTPIVIPTPDGKRILVFSAVFFSYPDDFEINAIDFELFHPPPQKKKKNKSWKNKPWKKLPSLLDYLKKIDAPRADFEVDSYGFITQSTLLIHIKFGFFTLDVDMPHPVWKKLDVSNICVPFDGPVFGIEGGVLWLTPAGAFDVSKGYSGMFNPISSPFYSSPFGKDFEFGVNFWTDMHTIYDKHGKLFGIVKLQLGIDERTKYVHMFLDVYNSNIDKYMNDKKKNVGADACLETSLIKTFKFIVDGDKCFLFTPLCLSPIQECTK